MPSICAQSLGAGKGAQSYCDVHNMFILFFFFQGPGQLTKMIFLVGLNVFLDYLGFLSTAEANVVAIFETPRGWERTMA